MADETENEKTIELRAHHLKNLCSKYLESEAKDNLDNICGKGAGAGAAELAFEMKISLYRPEFAIHSENVYTFLFQNPDMPVKIVDDFDIVCRKCPPQKIEKCLNDKNEDYRIADFFKLQINQEYKTRDIIERINLFGRTFLRKELERAGIIKY